MASTTIPLRRSLTAETLDSMSNEDLTSFTTMGDDSNSLATAPPLPAGGVTEETTTTRRYRRPILDRIHAKRLQVQRQQQLRGRQRSLVDDYYRVGAVPPRPTRRGERQQQAAAGGSDEQPVNNKQLKVVLPGVPTYEADQARDLHDFFNLVALVPVVVLNVLNWNWETLVQCRTFSSMENSWTGDYFQLFFWVSTAYFVVDLLWVAAIPTCVRSPTTILQHHVAVLLFLLMPYHFPHANWCMGACMSVELNTWFLIARRVFNKQGFPPWTLTVCSWVSIRVKIISIFFYLTWISIRCFLYPAILAPIYMMWVEHSKAVGTRCNVVFLALPLHSVFCLLNLKWSYELLMSKVRYFRRAWRKKGGVPVVQCEDSKGL